jgi:hypothetical protein
MKSEKKWTSSGGVEVGIWPFFDTGYKLRKLTMSECLGGIIGSGHISLYHDASDEALELVTDQYTLQIDLVDTKEGGVSYEIPAFITTKKFMKNTLEIEFLCVPGKEFFADVAILEWSDIGDALNSLYPGKKDIRCESDINNQIKIFQSGESNYTLAKTLAYSYKKKSIFCFGLEGFLLKDLIGTDSTGQKEPYWMVAGESTVAQMEPYKLNYDYKTYKENRDPWEEDYSDVMSENLRAQILDNEYTIIHKDYAQLIDNYNFNTNLMDTRMYNSFSITQANSLPVFKIGDVVKYRRMSEKSWMPITTFLVSQMDFFISVEATDMDSNGLQFSVTSVLRGVEEGGEILPTEDPSVE